ncbi:acyltransferase [Actinomyces sp. zg-332]|uniref:acyltransferase family protein n=1 Tax=Actinomyces sp. zg-332 TaxID=2708340 RepID=UPI0014237F87|nr:acyltransferase family protein [Actinomyces sp. zg-332]QPK93910.1 acyltransferase [Actinomyces sp. zg-332]
MFKKFNSVKVNASGRRVRGDIQALRALAVGLVILNHLWPMHLGGGYVGVDVFFVISGFLITSHLNRELEKNNGKVKLIQFYARRVRRLLPVAFFVITLSVISAWLLMPFSQWAKNIKELIASTFYVENLYLAYKAVDYHASAQSASIAQHYWSLSVEEQFYMLWPLLLMFFYFLAVKFKNKLLFPVFISIFGIISFIYCVFFTFTYQAQSYFFTPVRFWEFSVGALLAVVASSFKKVSYFNTIVALAGWVTIAISAVLFKPDSVFPGYIALIPVLGTALVIAAGIAGEVPILNKLTNLSIVRLTGDISYSLYLWHWPLIILAPYAFEQTLNYKNKLVILGITFILSYLSKTFIEDKGIRSVFLNKSSMVTFTSMLCAMSVIALSGYGVIKDGQLQIQKHDKEIQALGKDSCFGAKAISNPKCKNVDAPAYSVAMTEDTNAYWKLPDDCVPGESKDKTITNVSGQCDYSDSSSSKAKSVKTKKVFLIGDSHMQQWMHPIIKEARKYKWDMHWFLQGACPVADVQAIKYDECNVNTKKIHEHILKEKPDIIFYSNFSRNTVISTTGNNSIFEEYVDKMPVFWHAWVKNGATLINIADTPNVAKIHDPITCLEYSKDNPNACAVSRSEVLGSDPIVAASKKVSDKNIHLLDFSDYFCDSKVCKVSIGTVPVFYDSNHLNRVYLESFYSDFSEKVAKILAK